MRELIATGLAQEILPELMALTALPQPTEYHREGDTLTHSLATLAALPARASLPVAWAALLHDIGKAQTIVRTKRITYPGHAGVGAKLVQQIGKRLRWDRATLARVAWLTEQHMTLGDIPHMRPAHRHRLFTHPYFPDLLAVCRADARGTVPADQSLVRRVGRLYRETTGALALPAPRALLTGREIMSELHLPAGPEVGRLVRVLHDAQVESLVHDRASALAFLKKCVTR
jgi:poly(A) polymerase